MIHSDVRREFRSYHSFASLYDRLLGDRMFPLVRRNFEWLVRCYAIRYRSMAEVACGTGTFLLAFTQPGQRVFGVDQSRDMLAIARRKNGSMGGRYYVRAGI